jgi:phage head maturation protease
VELREISVVSAWPAYPDTSLALRAMTFNTERQRRERAIILAEMNRAIG